MFTVGLTGGIGCGKSTIEKYFKELGAGVVDTDVITHKLQQPGKTGFVFIKKLFGESFINFDGTLNRDMLRNLVFKDEAAKNKLEGLMTPLIYENVLNEINALVGSNNPPPYIILTVPLLVENKSDTFSRLVDRILVVDCPETIQAERVMKRSGLSKKEVERIISAQAPRWARQVKANDVIHNYECEPEDNLLVVKELHERYIELAKSK